MESGFSFELYETVFENCFTHSSRYANGNLQLSLFGVDPETNETAHFADITLNQNRKLLKSNEVIVDCLYKPTMLQQLLDLGILKNQVGIFTTEYAIYPIYTVDLTKISQKQYFMPELAVA